jgi:carbon storage regulator
MLVLSRKSGESIEIGDQRIIVHVLATRGSKVQLGIDAPREVAIHRSEKLPQRSEACNRDVNPPTTPVREPATDYRLVPLS